MIRFTLAVLTAALVLVPSAHAEEKTKVKPAGAWVRKFENDITITMKFKDDTFTCEVVTDKGASVTTTGNFGVTDDGVLFAILNKVDKKGTEEGPEKGELMSFGVKFTKDKLTISDFKGSVDRPQSKAIVEGDYEKEGK